MPRAALDGLDAQPLDIDLPIAKFDLTLTMRAEADRLEGSSSTTPICSSAPRWSA